MTREDRAAAAGAAVYSRPLLAVYDLLVLGFSNSLVWRCPSRLILAFYDAHVSGRHLDVGVGTGYFLDKCRFPTPHPALTLADLNPNSLQAAATRLRRYQPHLHTGNVLEPLVLPPASFDSIGINYVLHCLPGNMRDKARVFGHLKPLLRGPGGVIFGTTLLGNGVRRNALARRLMRVYNARGIFSTQHDQADDLERALQANFRDYTLRLEGCAAFFAGRI